MAGMLRSLCCSPAVEEDSDAGFMPALLTSLPDALKRAVMINLTPKELLDACLVSRDWKKVVYGDTVLRKVLQDEEDQRVADNEAVSVYCQSLGFPPQTRVGMSDLELGEARRQHASR